MPVVQNRAYNDPAIGQAFSNIAQLFAPPSAQDSYAYARAAAEKNEAARATRSYDVMVDPNTPQNVRDLYGVASKTYAPTQSWQALDMGDATTRRGQDIDSGDKRYGVDVNARTLLQTNSADNSRILQTNAADNTQKSISSLYQPLNPGQLAPAVPADIAGLVGLPGVDARVGAPKQLSVDELNAITLGQLPQGARERVAMGDVPVEQILDPTTGKPKVVYRPDAVGQQPYDKPSTSKAELTNYRAPDGSEGTAVYDSVAGFKDTQTGQPIPANSKMFNATLSGGSGETGLGKPTEAQQRLGYAAAMSEPAVKGLTEAFATGALPTQSDFLLFSGQKVLPFFTQPATVGAMSPQGQRFYQNLRTALPFQLMSQSGAAVTEDEYNRKLTELMPVPGEDPEVTKAKGENFQRYIMVTKGLSNGSYDQAVGKAPAGSPPAAGTSAPVPVASPAEALKLPSGTNIVLPDGSPGVVP